jgi:hypothetical protein
LQSQALRQFQLEQRADGTLVLRVADLGRQEPELRAVLAGLFGAGQPLLVEALPPAEGKRLQYRSELAP